MAEFLIRKNIEHLTGDELKKTRHAYKKIQDLPKNDKRSFHYHAGLHDVPGRYCWHDPKDHQGFPDVNLFLPWHRAYLYFFEKSLQDNDPTVTLPYWDWIVDERSQNPTVPKEFTDELDDTGQHNSLYNFHIRFPEFDNDRLTERFPGSRNLPGITSRERIDSIINDPDDTFTVFSENLRNVHNYVHVWTGGLGMWRNGDYGGGDMAATDYAAYDPIFWAHHCMIDKLWWEWQTKRGGEQNIPEDWKDMVLEPFELKVKDILNIHLLGYDYGIDGNAVEGNWRG